MLTLRFVGADVAFGQLNLIDSNEDILSIYLSLLLLGMLIGACVLILLVILFLRFFILFGLSEASIARHNC